MPAAPNPPPSPATWALLAVAVAVTLGGVSLDAVGLPSSYLFAALIIGLAIALRRPGLLNVPSGLFRAGQAVAGVTLGAFLQGSALRELAHDWLPVALVSAGTLALSLGAGRLLARVTPLDAPTAALGMIAGGASGIVGLSGELGADDRLVAFMQYLRVLIVVLSIPILVALAFGGTGDGGSVPAAPVLGDLQGWALTPVLALTGAALAVRLRLTAGVLLGPMLLTGAIVLAAGGGDALAVPPLLRETAFAVIGLQVGLRFTVATMRLLGRLIVPVTATILALLLASFGLALLLAATTAATLRDSYLATTPGGLYAVLAVASGSGADTTFVVAVQSLRVVVMVLLAPLAVRLALGRRADRPEADEARGT